MRVSERVRDGLLLAASWLFAIAYTSTNTFPDPDLWGRLSMGALVFQNGRFPYHDVFSYTALHARWVDHEWLTGLVFYQILTRFGETGFLAFKFLMMLGIIALIYRLHRKVYQASPLYAFYALILLMEPFSVGLFSTTRSHIFSFVFFLLELNLLEQVRLGQTNKRLLWLLAPLLVLWGNLHGGVAMGLLLLGCYGLGEMVIQRSFKAGLLHWLVAGASVLLLGLLNPYGPTYLSFLWHAWTLDRSKIGEWTPLRFTNDNFLPAQLMFVFGISLLILRWFYRNRQDAGELKRLLTPSIVVTWLIVMLLRAVRIQTFTALVMTAYLPVLLNADYLCHVAPAAIRQFFQRQQFVICKLVPAMVLVMVTGMVVFLQTTVNLFKSGLTDEMSQSNVIVARYPIAAMNYLKSSPYRGNLMVQFGVGEFMLWALYPQFKVSMDGRYEEVYSQEEFLRSHYTYSKAHPLKNWASFAQIDAGKTDFVLMPVNLPVNVPLLQSPNWKFLYGDPYYAIYGRVSTLNRFPEFKRPLAFMNTKEISIGDLVTDADLKRFKTSEY